MSPFVDAALLHLSEPIDTGVGPLSLFSGDTDDLIGDEVFCAGYGAFAVGAACGSGKPACPSGQFCQYGGCLTIDGRLRAARFKIIEDPDHPDTYYRFDVPNALGQIKLPGDSGSSCWNGSALTGVFKAGSLSNYNRDTSAEAFRDWVNRTVFPPDTYVANLPGASCRPARGGKVRYTADGEVENPKSKSVTLVCPVRRNWDPEGRFPFFSSVASAPRVFVHDRSASEEICCRLEGRGSGTTVLGGMQCSTGVDNSYQTLNVPSVYVTDLSTHFQLICTLPPKTSSGNSELLGYRTRQTITEYEVEQD